MQHLEVSGAVRHIYIYIYIYVIRRLKFKLLNLLTGMSEVCLLGYGAIQLTKICHSFQGTCSFHLQNNGIIV